MKTDTFDSEKIDYEGFHEELKKLRAEIDASLSPADLAHLQKIERLGRAATALGLLTAGLAPNPLSAAALALGRSTRWIVMHHVGHRGYDKVPGVPERYKGRVFAHGRRRFLDWFDWMLPEAWIYEHNILHHQFTGEERDPDLIERNADSLRKSSLPSAVKYAIVGLLGASWRPVYYAPNTTRQWYARHGDDHEREATRALWLQGYLPYATVHFVAMPLAYSWLGPWGVMSALCNSLAADVLCNLHTFLVVGPNHSGDDLYRFEDRPASKGEFYVRQVVGSVNFRCGGDLNDYAHLWLNYQIEHHLFPDIPMTKYQEVQPRVKALCERFGVPYVQESVFTRFRKMADVFVGKATMRNVRSLARREDRHEAGARGGVHVRRDHDAAPLFEHHRRGVAQHATGVVEGAPADAHRGVDPAVRAHDLEMT